MDQKELMTQDGIRFLRGSSDDWEKAMELAWLTYLKYEAPEYDKEGTDNFLNLISGESLFKMFLAGEYKLYVAKEDGRIVGMAGVRNKCHISLLFVNDRYHRKGIGTGLLKLAQDDVAAFYGSCRLTVNASPYAKDFYKKLGFTETDKEQHKDGIIYYPMTCLVRIGNEAGSNAALSGQILN